MVKLLSYVGKGHSLGNARSHIIPMLLRERHRFWKWVSRTDRGESERPFLFSPRYPARITLLSWVPAGHTQHYHRDIIVSATLVGQLNQAFCRLVEGTPCEHVDNFIFADQVRQPIAA